jgi:hypothetical protein
LKKRPEGRLLEDFLDEFIEFHDRFLQFLDFFEDQILIHFFADFFLL